MLDPVGERWLLVLRTGVFGFLAVVLALDVVFDLRQQPGCWLVSLVGLFRSTFVSRVRPLCAFRSCLSLAWCLQGESKAYTLALRTCRTLRWTIIELLRLCSIVALLLPIKFSKSHCVWLNLFGRHRCALCWLHQGQNLNWRTIRPILPSSSPSIGLKFAHSLVSFADESPLLWSRSNSFLVLSLFSVRVSCIGI